MDLKKTIVATDLAQVPLTITRTSAATAVLSIFRAGWRCVPVVPSATAREEIEEGGHDEEG
jgi:hypothetical protein